MLRRSSSSRGTAAPARRTVGVQVVLRAVVHLSPHRPPRPRSGRPRTDRPRGTRRRRIHARSARRTVRNGRRLSVFRAGLRESHVGRRRSQPDHPRRCASRVPRRGGELAVGFFGSRYERATPAEREYMRAMAELSGDDGPVPTSKIAVELGRKPASLSPARDGLIKKGLIYSAERGFIGFTVPHFGKYLRAQTD